MKSGLLCFSGLLGVLLATPVLAQTAPVITIEKVMTGAERHTTGVDRLTPAQRSALDRWLSAYTMQVIQFVRGSAKPAASGAGDYTGSGGGHWIKSKLDNGGTIILEDGSMWEISSVDRIDTSLWLPISNVTILKASSPVGDYRYTLVNIDEGEKALAKFLGKQ